ncbi:MAG: hypothetical protein ACE3L7_29765 [Candidatus Pristimantibacillus sp.]
MASTETSVIEGATKAIRSMTEAVNLTIDLLKKLEKQVNNNGNMAKAFINVKNQITGVNREIIKVSDELNISETKARSLGKLFERNAFKIKAFAEAGSQISQVSDAIEKTTGAQENFNKTVEENDSAKKNAKNEEKESTWSKGIKQLYGAVKNPAKKMVKMSFDGAMEEQGMMDKLFVTTGNTDQSAGIFEMVKKNALKSGSDVGKAFTGALNFMPMVQNIGQLEKLTQFSTRMAAFDPAGGDAEASSKVVKSAMSGDYSEISKQFQMPEASVKKILGDTSDMDSFLKAFDQLLAKADMGEKAFDELLKSPAKQLATLKEYFTTSFAGAGSGAIAALSPLFTMLIEAFESGKFQPFFDMLNNGLALGAEFLAVLGEKVLGFFGIFEQYWPVIIALLPAFIAGLWAMVTPILAQAAAWLLANWPIVLIMLAIGLLIGILISFGTTTEQIIGFITGVFFALFAFIKNGVAYLWNIFIVVAEFLVNIFIDPVYAIKKLFFDLVKNVVNFFGGMINTFIEGLNWVLQKVNNITGTKFKIDGEIDTSAIDQFKPTSDKAVIDLSAYQMKKTDLGGAFSKDNEAGKNFAANGIDKVGDFKDQLNGGASGFPATPPGGGIGSGGNIDRVGEVGKINETVDISSEDLKTMRELAEMKNIQNFVSLQPSISVQTGDINNGYDIDTIIGRLERSLNDEIASSAEGVYA